MNPISFLRALVVLGILIAVQQASAAPVNWGTSRLATNFTSDLQPLGQGGGFTFEVGAFRDGFEPSNENTDQWADRWIAIGKAGYNTQLSFAAGSAQTDLQQIAEGSRGYIWGFDSREDGSVEWILVSDPSWLWQYSGAETRPVDWTVGSAGEVVLGQVGDSASTFHMQTAALTLGSTPAQDAEAWRSGQFAGELDAPEAAWDADADGDGLNNALEFAFGTSPHDANQVVRASASVTRIGGQPHMSFRYDGEIKPAAPVSVQVSNDLSNWQPAGDSVEIISGNGTYEFRDTLPMTSGRRFFRLHFEL